MTTNGATGSSFQYLPVVASVVYLLSFVAPVSVVHGSILSVVRGSILYVVRGSIGCRLWLR